MQTSLAYYFKIALQRLWCVNTSISEIYLMKCISSASRSRMPEIIKLGKTMKKDIDGILEEIRSCINSTVVDYLNYKIHTAFKCAYGFNSQECRDKTIYLMVADLTLPIIN
ncbi:MAG: transposase [Thermoplasmataceae archaeon]